MILILWQNGISMLQDLVQKLNQIKIGLMDQLCSKEVGSPDQSPLLVNGCKKQIIPLGLELGWQGTTTKEIILT